MATLLNSQIIAEQYTDFIEDSRTEELKEAGVLTDWGYQSFPGTYKSADEALRFVETKNNLNKINYISRTVSDKYKKVSEDLNEIQTRKSKVRKKTMKELMQQSFFHGASWIGSNFIA